jgi:hypothetical protein
MKLKLGDWQRPKAYREGIFTRHLSGSFYDRKETRDCNCDNLCILGEYPRCKEMTMGVEAPKPSAPIPDNNQASGIPKFKWDRVGPNLFD